MRYTYLAGANASTNGVSLGAAGEDIRVYKLIIGVPVASGEVVLHNKAIAMNFSSDADDIAFRYTLGADIAPEGLDYVYSREIDFGVEGLPLDGGNLQCDQAMQITVLWEKAA